MITSIPIRQVLALTIITSFPLMALTGCNDSHTPAVVSVAPRPQDALSLDEQSLLNVWAHQHYPPPPKKIDSADLTALEKADRFNCARYIVDDNLVGALREAPQLRYLHVDTRTLNGDILWVAELRNLEGLVIHDAHPNGTDLHCIGRLRNLRWLAVEPLAGPAGDSIWLPDLPNLTTLYLLGDNITDAQIPQRGQFPKLKELWFEYATITDKGMGELVASYPELTSLECFYCKGITKASVSHIGSLRNLQGVGLCGTSLASEYFDTNKGVLATEELRRRLPGCRVSISE